MDLLEGVPVLQSLEGQAIFECAWCGNVTLVRKQEPLRTPTWLGSLPVDCPVSFAALCHRFKLATPVVSMGEWFEAIPNKKPPVSPPAAYREL
jgi:hypothetical protein